MKKLTKIMDFSGILDEGYVNGDGQSLSVAVASWDPEFFYGPYFLNFP